MRRVLLAAAVAAALLSPAAAGAADRVLRILTHSSFAISPALVQSFEKSHGAALQFSAGGDGGETLTRALLSKASPVADVIYGIDNTFMGRALSGDILQPYASPLLAGVPQALRLDPTNRLLPVDFGYVALNYDRAWFAARGLAVPATLEQLAEPAYAGLLVVENPATSSTGLAFLLATVARFGETGARTWKTWWASLVTNGVLVVNGWDDAYYNEFSASGRGKRPLVVSYATSPAYELYNAPAPRPAEAPTGSIVPEGASFRQVEFVGILKGARDLPLAKAFVDFMLSPEVQADLPLQMWVYPASERAAVPDLFRAAAPVPRAPAAIAPALIDQGRDRWIREWTAIVLR